MTDVVRRMKLFGYILLFGIVGVAILYFWLEGSDVDVVLTSKYKDRVRTVQETVHEQTNLSLTNLTSKKTRKSFKAPSANCEAHQDIILKAFDQERPEKWALRMVDAIGRQPSGLLHDQGNRLWLGSWEGCLDVVPRHATYPGNRTAPFKPMYCKVRFNVHHHPKFFKKRVVIGMCFPDTCDTASLLPFADQLIRYTLSQNLRLKAKKVECEPPDVPLSDDAWTVIHVCGYLGAVMVVATLYDLFIYLWLNKRNKKTSKKITNGSDHCDKFRHTIHNTLPINAFIANEKSPLYGDVIQHKTSTEPGSRQANDADVRNMVEVSTGYTKASNTSDVDDVKYKPSIFGRLLLCFSVYSNCCKILDTAPKRGTLGALHGIRFLSTCWVILGHSFSMKRHPDNYDTWLAEMMKRRSFMLIANCSVAVDTFFVLSGSLVALLTLRQMRSRGGAHRVNWPLYYFHRIWRLTPTYAFVMAIYGTLSGYWASGPLWSSYARERTVVCKEYWWSHLLYINNIVHNKCIGWTWYLANDMQYYFVAPLMLIPLYYSRLLGSILCLAIINYSIHTAYETSAHNNLFDIMKADRLFDNGNATSSRRVLLIRAPRVRVGAYAVGILLGYILYATNCKANIGKFLNIVGWVVAMTLLYLVVFWPYTPDGRFHFTVTAAATYTALHRVAWALAVAWLIFACATGYGGLVNKLLSWPVLVPLSRLCYCAYLVHPIVIYTAVGSVRALPHWYDIDFAVRYAGYLTLSIAAAFFVSLMFEAPFLGLEKVLLERQE